MNYNIKYNQPAFNIVLCFILYGVTISSRLLDRWILREVLYNTKKLFWRVTGVKKYAYINFLRSAVKKTDRIFHGILIQHTWLDLSHSSTSLRTTSQWQPRLNMTSHSTTAAATEDLDLHTIKNIYNLSNFSQMVNYLVFTRPQRPPPLTPGIKGFPLCGSPSKPLLFVVTIWEGVRVDYWPAIISLPYLGF